MNYIHFQTEIHVDPVYEQAEEYFTNPARLEYMKQLDSEKGPMCDILLGLGEDEQFPEKLVQLMVKYVSLHIFHAAYMTRVTRKLTLIVEEPVAQFFFRFRNFSDPKFDARSLMYHIW